MVPYLRSQLLPLPRAPVALLPLACCPAGPLGQCPKSSCLQPSNALPSPAAQTAPSSPLQPGGGHVFLVEGNGSWGNATPGTAAYGCTKRALTQLKDSLAAECKGSPVGVHM